MALRHVWRCLRYLSLVVIAGMFIAGCVIQEPRAITEIGRARKALDDAKRAGAADQAPDKFAARDRLVGILGGSAVGAGELGEQGSLWRRLALEIVDDEDRRALGTANEAAFRGRSGNLQRRTTVGAGNQTFRHGTQSRLGGLRRVKVKSNFPAGVMQVV